MVLRNNYTHSQYQQVTRRGFTLLEILIVLALLSGIASLAVFFSWAEYRTHARLVEKGVLVELLQTARTRAMNNQSGLPHGVLIASAGCVGYELFSGASYEVSDPASRFCTKAVYPLKISGTNTVVVFSQLSGTTSPNVLQLVDTITGATSTILINAEGYTE